VKNLSHVHGFLLAGLSGVLSLVGCGGNGTAARLAVPPVTTAQPVPGSALKTADAHAAYVAYVPGPVRFENPGGMWMPHQMRMKEHSDKLKQLGLAIDPAELAEPTSNVLSSVVSLGGCSASFVSAEGLVITNHHCAIGALQLNSTASSNLLRDGFYAKTRAEERSNGPAARVYVTVKSTDITKAILSADLAKQSDVQRFRTLEKRQKEAVSACEKDRPGIRCSVPAFYDGGAYYMIEQLELRDVRLVYAPPEGVGNYGGEIDNWRWPRHTGDVSIFRAYASPDNKPADFSTSNVPYKPKSFLKVASKPLDEGDLVMVAGYPGRTYSQKTRAEAEDYVGFRYPRSQKLCEDYIATFEKLGLPGSEDMLRANPLIRRFGNQLTNVKGQLDGLVKDGLLDQKKQKEALLAAYIKADPAREAKFGKLLADIDAAYVDTRKYRESDAVFRSEALLPKLTSAAYTIVRMAEERPKADAERDPEYQERNWPRIFQGLEALEKQYSVEVDKALLGRALERTERAPEAERVQLRGLLKQVSADVDPVVGAYKATLLGDQAKRLGLARTATLSELSKSTDPLVKFALLLRPLVKAAEDREHALLGRLALLKPAYFEVLSGFEGKPVAADANGTLRITYGTVRGYRPKSDAAMYLPFTFLPEVVAKNTGKDPFEVPKSLLTAAAARKFGSYVHPRFGQVPVDFLSDLHITGGNSGSATLNERGEITGLVFDGNYEALASDWLFKPVLTRSIHVDLRYVLWLLDAVEQAHPLLRELGVKPQFETK
jgi:hypothetical protein